MIHLKSPWEEEQEMYQSVKSMRMGTLFLNRLVSHEFACVQRNRGEISWSGCYNAPSMCTSSAAMGQDAASFASWKFKGKPQTPNRLLTSRLTVLTSRLGSALYITSLLNSMSPEFTVTIDGSAIDVDGARPGFLPFDCFTLFAKTGLDPNVEHAVNLTIKGPSPNRNMTFPPSTAFSLVNYT